MSPFLKFGGMIQFLTLALIITCEEWGDDVLTHSIPQTKHPITVSRLTSQSRNTRELTPVQQLH